MNLKVVVGTVAGILVQAAMAQPGVYQVVEVAQPGWFECGVEAVSNSGWSAGWASSFQGDVLWRRSPQGEIETLDFIGDVSGGDTTRSNIRGDSSGSIFINNTGDVAASSGFDEDRQAFFYPLNGLRRRINGFSDTDLGGLNDAGAVAGSGRTGPTSTVGFAGMPSSPATFNGATAVGSGSLSGYLNWVSDLNNAGAVVGCGTSGTVGTRPYIMHNGVISFLRIPSGYIGGMAEGISESGIVVGRVLNPVDSPVNDFRVVVWNGGNATPISAISWTPPAGYFRVPDVKPYRINNAGRAVGHIRYLPPQEWDTENADFSVTEQSRGFITDGGRMYDLNTLLEPGSRSWTIVCANDIADSGWIAASARPNGQGGERAVLLRLVGGAGGGGGGQGPASPQQVALAARSDTGASNSDRVTAAATLVFAGTADAGSRVTAFVDGIATPRKTTADRNGRFSLSFAGAPAGTHVYTFVATNVRTNQSSQPSGGVEVTRDAVAPDAPGIMSLAPADVVTPTPRGASAATRNTTPTLRGVAAPGSVLNVYAGGRVVATTTVPANGMYEITIVTAMRRGKVTELTAKAIDQAGNASKPSAKCKVAVVN